MYGKILKNDNGNEPTCTLLENSSRFPKEKTFYIKYNTFLQKNERYNNSIWTWLSLLKRQRTEGKLGKSPYTCSLWYKCYNRSQLYHKITIMGTILDCRTATDGESSKTSMSTKKNWTPEIEWSYKNHLIINCFPACGQLNHRSTYNRQKDYAEFFFPRTSLITKQYVEK